MLWTTLRESPFILIEVWRRYKAVDFVAYGSNTFWRPFDGLNDDCRNWKDEFY